MSSGTPISMGSGWPKWAVSCENHWGQSESHGSVIATRTIPAIIVGRHLRGSTARIGLALANANRTGSAVLPRTAATITAAIARLNVAPSSDSGSSGIQSSQPTRSHEPAR